MRSSRTRTNIEAAGHGGDEQGPLFRPIRNNHTGCIRRSSLKAGIVAPSVMLRKLADYRRQNQLDLALQELGRMERPLFMLDWLESPELRRRCHAGLNKSEQRHFLAQVICTFKQGRIADHSAEVQQFRASGLNLVIAAIVFWNSTYIADAIAHLRDGRHLDRICPTRPPRQSGDPGVACLHASRTRDDGIRRQMPHNPRSRPQRPCALDAPRQGLTGLQCAAASALRTA